MLVLKIPGQTITLIIHPLPPDSPKLTPVLTPVFSHGSYTQQFSDLFRILASCSSRSPEFHLLNQVSCQDIFLNKFNSFPERNSVPFMKKKCLPLHRYAFTTECDQTTVWEHTECYEGAEEDRPRLRTRKRYPKGSDI